MDASSGTALEIRAFPADFPSTNVLSAEPVAEHRPFYDGLCEGRLVLQVCTVCDRPRFPIAPVCPYCTHTELRWTQMRPDGTVHSWARYHRAYLPEFASLVPYVVLTVRLDDGVLIVGRLADAVSPRIDMPVRAISERWTDGGHVLAFSASKAAG